MTAYNANTDILARQRQIAADRAGYENVLLLAQEERAAVLARFEEQHAAWQLNPMGEVPEQPPPPDPIPEPSVPDAPLPVFEARAIEKPTSINTRTGEALVIPPRVVLTDEEGFEFALSVHELASDYTEVGS